MSSYDIPNTSGIYRIVCIPTGKLYLGSAVHLRKRWQKHSHQLLHKVHHSVPLQRAWDKYGPDAFLFEIVELVRVPFLLEREQYWLDILKPYDPANGFNIDRIAGSRLGSEVSSETREKLRKANLGKKQSEETIRKRVEAGKGRTHSAETKETIRLIRLGTKRSSETRERLSLVHHGKKHSPETREKMSATRLGHSVSESTRAKISATNATTKGMKPLIAISPEGTEYVIRSGLSKFCREHTLSSSNLTNVAKGILPQTKGWIARYI